MAERCDRCRRLMQAEGDALDGGRYSLCQRCVDALVASHAYVHSDWVFSPVPIVATSEASDATVFVMSASVSQDSEG
jgi:hypothetical protein